MNGFSRFVVPTGALVAALCSLSVTGSIAAQQSGETSRKAIGFELALAQQEPGAHIRSMPVASTGRSGSDPLAEVTLQRKSDASQPSAEPVQGPVIVGRVLYRGAVPAPTQIDVSRDRNVCGATMMVAALSVDPATSGLRDAVVHVESGVGAVPARGAASMPAVVRNKQCRFYPRVGVMQSGGDAEIVNEDPVTHNTNMTLANRTVLNVAVVAGGAPIRKPIRKAGLHVVKCNVHKFMQAYRMVFDDPYFDQTNDTGQFRISGIASGRQTLTVWHETLGVLQKEVQVPAQGTVVVDLEYK